MNLGPATARGDLSTRHAPAAPHDVFALARGNCKQLRGARGSAPSGHANALVSTSVGVVRIDGGGRAVSAGVKAAGSSNYRFPPPDSGVVPFSEELTIAN